MCSTTRLCQYDRRDFYSHVFANPVRYISLYTLFKNPFINIKKEKNNNNNKHIVFFCFLQTSWAQHSQTVLKISLQQLIEATRQRQ